MNHSFDFCGVKMGDIQCCPVVTSSLSSAFQCLSVLSDGHWVVAPRMVLTLGSSKRAADDSLMIGSNSLYRLVSRAFPSWGVIVYSPLQTDWLNPPWRWTDRGRTDVGNCKNFIWSKSGGRLSGMPSVDGQICHVHRLYRWMWAAIGGITAQLQDLPTNQACQLNWLPATSLHCHGTGFSPCSCPACWVQAFQKWHVPMTPQEIRITWALCKVETSTECDP